MEERGRKGGGEFEITLSAWSPRVDATKRFWRKCCGSPKLTNLKNVCSERLFLRHTKWQSSTIFNAKLSSKMLISRKMAHFCCFSKEEIKIIQISSRKSLWHRPLQRPSSVCNGSFSKEGKIVGEGIEFKRLAAYIYNTHFAKIVRRNLSKEVSILNLLHCCSSFVLQFLSLPFFLSFSLFKRFGRELPHWGLQVHRLCPVLLTLRLWFESPS